MQYAIIQTGGKQYLVNEGDTLLVDKLPDAKDEFTISKVLFFKNDDQYLIGQPLVDKVTVKAKILSQVKGKKLRISKFKAKVNYRRTMGFRPLYSKILIEKFLVKK